MNRGKPPGNDRGRPGEKAAPSVSYGDAQTIPQADDVPMKACPCGCTTKPPYVDDRRCIRHEDPAERYRRRRAS